MAWKQSCIRRYIPIWMDERGDTRHATGLLRRWDARQCCLLYYNERVEISCFITPDMYLLFTKYTNASRLNASTGYNRASVRIYPDLTRFTSARLIPCRNPGRLFVDFTLSFHFLDTTQTAICSACIRCRILRHPHMVIHNGLIPAFARSWYT